MALRISLIDESKWPEDYLRQTEPIRTRVKFTSNSYKVLAHQPRMAASMARLTNDIFYHGQVDPAFKMLVRALTSQANGCRYCSTHQLNNLQTLGQERKLADLWNFPTSPLFSPRERATLAVVLKLVTDRTSATDADFDELKRHWSEADIVEILMTVAMMSFLNFVNDAVDLPLDDYVNHLGEIALDRSINRLPRRPAPAGTAGG